MEGPALSRVMKFVACGSAGGPILASFSSLPEGDGSGAHSQGGLEETMNKRQGLRNAFLVSAALTVILQDLPAQAEPVVIDSALLDQLQSTIAAQQDMLARQSEQLSTQAQTIQTLTGRVDRLEQNTAQTKAIAAEAQTTASAARTTATAAQTTATAAQTTATAAHSTATQAMDSARRTGDNTEPTATAVAASGYEAPVVTSGNDKVKLTISGQVNQAINVANDGDSTRAYFVDNDVSNTRVRFDGTAAVTESTTVGSTVEIAFSPNNSYDVSQNNQNAGDFIDVRRAEAFAQNDAFGRLSLGKGSAAADDTAEYDLSLVAGPIMYAGVADPVGGLLFYDGTALSGITVGDAFFDFDGDRQNRVRYDSPVFGPGVQLSISAGDNQRYDAAVTWGGDYGNWTGVEVGPFTTLGALSIRDPNVDDVNFRLAGSFSALHNESGVSLTVSGGMDDTSSGSDPYNLYGKLGWDTSFFKIGPTGFGIDATYSENLTGQGDQGTSFGLAAIQLIENYGIELYAQARYFDLDRKTGSRLDNIVVGTIGTRVKF